MKSFSDSVAKYKKRRKARLDARGYKQDGVDDVEEWITVNGSHIPLKDGKAVGEVMKGEDFSDAKTNKAQEIDDLDDGPKKGNRKFSSADDVLRTINKYFDSDYAWAFGIRADKEEKKTGDVFENSHQLFQDDPSEWGEDAEYIDELGLWDAGELPGTCAVGVTDGYTNTTKEQLEKALKAAKQYKAKGYKVYLVGTKGTVEGGNDIGEYIMSDAICFGEIEDGVLK